jgi:hypothetical protein
MGGDIKSSAMEMGFSESEINQWREGVVKIREKMFRKHWKNRRQIPDLVSRTDARNFEFIVEWYDESPDFINRNQERRRLDKLIAIGVDVNLPREQQPVV